MRAERTVACLTPSFRQSDTELASAKSYLPHGNVPCRHASLAPGLSCHLRNHAFRASPPRYTL